MLLCIFCNTDIVRQFLFYVNQVFVSSYVLFLMAYTRLYIQLTPALTDYKGPTIFICFKWISVFANIEIKEKLFRELKNIFCYRLAIFRGSIGAGFDCESLFSWVDSFFGPSLCQQVMRLKSFQKPIVLHLYKRVCPSICQLPLFFNSEFS